MEIVLAILNQRIINNTYYNMQCMLHWIRIPYTGHHQFFHPVYYMSACRERVNDIIYTFHVKHLLKCVDIYGR